MAESTRPRLRAPRSRMSDVVQRDSADPLSVLVAIVNPLAHALGPKSEVVLHDFKRLPNSIVAISGNLTGRAVGGPMTDLLLKRLREGKADDLIRYRSTGPTGDMLISSTIFVRDSTHTPVGCLCVNTDATQIAKAQLLLTSLLPSEVPFEMLDEPSSGVLTRGDESFPQTVEQLTTSAVMDTIASIGVPVALMHKKHKLEVVRELDRRGIFLIRDSVEYVAASLDVTRYTIYNYLNSIDPDYATRSTKRRQARAQRVSHSSTARVALAGTSR